MLSEQNIALKEWAIVCQALATGSQSIVVRKGGIDEGPAGFAPTHKEFWLLPTNFHQSSDALNDRGKQLLDNPNVLEAFSGSTEEIYSVRRYVEVDSFYRVQNEDQLEQLQSMQVLSPDTVHMRFHYRDPGLWIMLLRVYENEQVYQISNSEHIAGCRSWVDLPQPLPVSSPAPVLDESRFQSEKERLQLAFPKPETL